MKAHEAVELAERMSNLASTNVLDRIDTSNAKFHSELKALSKTLEAKIDAQNAKYNLLIWMIGFATAILSAVILFTNNGG